LYILHPPGGVVGGDELYIDMLVSKKAKGLMTTPGATKIYRSDSKTMILQQTFVVEEQATLEWLPQETIIFDGAFVDSTTKVNLVGNSKYIGWEIVCFGRPGAGEVFEHGLVRMNLEIWRDDLPIWLDRTVFPAETETNSIFQAAWGLNSSPVMATLIASSCTQQIHEALTEQHLEKGSYSTSLIEDVLVCRYIGACSQEAKACFLEIWSQLRPRLLNRSPCPPRVWNT
jgi:urease accessory protein